MLPPREKLSPNRRETNVYLDPKQARTTVGAVALALIVVLIWMFVVLTQRTPAAGACSVYAGSRDGLTAAYDGEAYVWTAKNDTVFGFSTGVSEEMYLTRGCAVYEGP